MSDDDLENIFPLLMVLGVGVGMLVVIGGLFSIY